MCRNDDNHGTHVEMPDPQRRRWRRDQPANRGFAGARAPHQPYSGIAVRDVGTERVHGCLSLRLESTAPAVCRVLAVLTGQFGVLVLGVFVSTSVLSV